MTVRAVPGGQNWEAAGTTVETEHLDGAGK